MKHGVPSVPSWTEWLTKPMHSSSFLPSGSKVGLDPALITVADYTTLAPALTSAGVELVPIRENLVDVAWEAEAKEKSGGKEGKPARPKNEVFVLDVKYAGEGAKSKIERVRKEMEKDDVFGGDAKAKSGDKRCWGVVLTQLDEIACACACPAAAVARLISLAFRASQPPWLGHILQPRLLLLACSPDRLVLQAHALHRYRPGAAEDVRLPQRTRRPCRALRQLDWIP